MDGFVDGSSATYRSIVIQRPRLFISSGAQRDFVSLARAISNQMRGVFRATGSLNVSRIALIRIFKAQVNVKLTAVRSGDALPLILRALAARWGRPKGIFTWDRFQIEAVRSLLDHASPNGVAAIRHAICEDFRAMRAGFPEYYPAHGHHKRDGSRCSGFRIYCRQISRIHG
ncbi:hypothetical protein [Bradyrhizobium sp. SZCCHNR1015]|uniref:hypothetical protein n=1 Tax=Bradyrhizobium sp. SZCCHNR1015 TaxID=3057338 RepID=UPI00291625AF|nr:hypothetical protein [Bradyrhizobium sp. SZCCHNR1015]